MPPTGNEIEERNALLGEFAGRGVTNTAGAKRQVRQLEERFHRRRIAVRLTITAVVLICAAATAEEYTRRYADFQRRVRER